MALLGSFGAGCERGMSRRALVNILIISCTSGVVALLVLLAATLCHKYAKARRKAKQAVLLRGSSLGSV